jgi:hypothetical protein
MQLPWADGQVSVSVGGAAADGVTAIPELLEGLDLRGATVTMDAMGCAFSTAHREAKKPSSMACCDWFRIVSKAPISAGSGSLRLRVKALGKSGCRAICAKSSLAIRSDNSSIKCCMNSQY